MAMNFVLLLLNDRLELLVGISLISSCYINSFSRAIGLMWVYYHLLTFQMGEKVIGFWGFFPTSTS